MAVFGAAGRFGANRTGAVPKLPEGDRPQLEQSDAMLPALHSVSPYKASSPL